MRSSDYSASEGSDVWAAMEGPCLMTDVWFSFRHKDSVCRIQLQ